MTLIMINFFTIQNVPIKSNRIKNKYNDKLSLQYKMFLLNEKTLKLYFKVLKLYNTKCSY